MRKGNKQFGFSLIEMMVAVGILSVVAVGTSVQLISSYKAGVKTNSKANMIESAGLISQAFSKTSVNAQTCANTLQFAQNFNTTTGAETNVRLAMNNQILQANFQMTGANPFTIVRLYLGDTNPLPNRPNSYLTNLYLIADVGPQSSPMRMKPRSLGAVVVTLNSNGTLKECNVSNSIPTNHDACDALYGMVWNPQTNQCDQAMRVDANNNLPCPPGTYKDGNICVPTATGCGFGQLARGFNMGLVQTCATPPLNPAVGQATASVPPPVEGVPDRQPALVNPARRINSVVPIGQIAGSGSSVPATCTDGSTIGVTDYQYCSDYGSCLPSGPSPVGSECVNRTPASTSTPPPATTPAPAPPPDLSCQCNSARISDGSYCMYCIPNVDVGFGYVDYAYGVARCDNGQLVPDSSATGTVQVPPPECSGGWAPVPTSGGGGGGIRQMRTYSN